MDGRVWMALVEVARSARLRHSGWSWRGGGGAGLRAGLPAGVERTAWGSRGRKPGFGRELDELLASLLSFSRL